MGKQSLGKQIINESKKETKKQKRDTNMKNLLNNSTFKTVRTVVLTLVTLAALGAVYFAGFNQGRQYESDMHNTIETRAKALTAATPSK